MNNYFLGSHGSEDPYNLRNSEKEISEKFGFLPGTKLLEKTKITVRRKKLLRGLSDHAWLFSFRVGRDYKGPKLPEGTEAVTVINFKDGRQCIYYQHRAMPMDREIMQTFKTEVRKSEKRVLGNTVELGDFVQE